MTTLSDIVFLCGCHLNAKVEFGYERKFVDGKEVCPEHGIREYGFMTKDALALGRLSMPRKEGQPS